MTVIYKLKVEITNTIELIIKIAFVISIVVVWCNHNRTNDHPKKAEISLYIIILQPCKLLHFQFWSLSTATPNARRPSIVHPNSLYITWVGEAALERYSVTDELIEIIVLPPAIVLGFLLGGQLSPVDKIRSPHFTWKLKKNEKRKAHPRNDLTIMTLQFILMYVVFAWIKM